MELGHFVSALMRDEATTVNTPVEAYNPHTGAKYDIVDVYTDYDEHKGLIVCVDVEPVE